MLKDLVRGGDPVMVDERLGSRSAARWDRIGTRVLRIGEHHCLSGTVLHFPFEAADSVLKVFRTGAGTVEAKTPGGIVDEDARNFLFTSLLANAAHVFSRIYVAQTLAALREPPPQMTNFEGDRILFTSVRFPVAPGANVRVERSLDSAKAFERIPGEAPQWAWKAQAEIAAPRSPAGQEARMVFGSFAESSTPILGHVELQGAELMLRVNSLSRAERGKALLAELLGDLAGDPVTSTQSLESAIEEHRAHEHMPSAGATGPSPEVEARILHSYLERHYRRTLHEPIPTLGDASPHDAIQTAEGREKVIMWLKFLENAEERRARSSGQLAFDMTWMWKELGILDRRG